jgi:hypothetical protein
MKQPERLLLEASYRDMLLDTLNAFPVLVDDV